MSMCMCTCMSISMCTSMGTSTDITHGDHTCMSMATASRLLFLTRLKQQTAITSSPCTTIATPISFCCDVPISLSVLTIVGLWFLRPPLNLPRPRKPGTSALHHSAVAAAIHPGSVGVAVLGWRGWQVGHGRWAW